MNTQSGDDDEAMVALARIPLPADMLPTAEHRSRVKELLGEKTTPAPSPWIRWRREALAVAAIVLAVAGILLFAPNEPTPNLTAWSAAADWVHAEFEDQGDGKLDLYVSAELGVQSYVLPNGFRIEDATHQRQFIKRSWESTVYGQPLTPEAAEKFLRLMKTFIAQTTYPSELDFEDDTELVSDEAHEVMVDGEPMTERTIVVRYGSEKVQSIIHYDRATSRAVRSTSTYLSTGKEISTVRYDYPKTGPATLRAFGIRDDVPIVQGFPPKPWEWRDTLRWLDRVHRSAVGFFRSM